MVNVPQVDVGKAGTARRILLKIYSVIFLTTFTAFASGLLFVEERTFFGVVLLLLFLVFFALQIVLLAAADNYLRTAVIINSVGWALPFYIAFSLYFLAAFGFLVLFLFLAAKRGKDEMENSLNIKIRRIVRTMIGFSLTGVVIFAFASMILANRLILTEKKVRGLTETLVSPIAKRYVRDFSPDMETGTFFVRIAQRNIAIAASRSATNREVAKLEKDIENRIGTEIDLNRSVSENFYQALQFKINTLTPRAKLYWALIILAIVFLSIKSVEFLIAWPLTVIVYLFYQLLLAFNFTSVGLKDRSQEVVMLK